MRKDLDVDLVVEMYCEMEMNCQEIADVFDASPKTIWNRLKERGVVLRASRNRLDVTEAIRLYRDENWTLKEVSSHFGVSIDCVYRHLKDHDISTSSKIDLDVDKIVELYNNNISCRKIGKLFNVSGCTIRERLKDVGITDFKKAADYNTGKHLTSEHKRKVGEASKKLWQDTNYRNDVISKITGRKMSLEARKNMSAAQRGKKRKPLTPEHRAKIGASGIGRVNSAETRAKLSAANKDPVVMAKHIEKMHRLWSDPDYRKAHSGSNSWAWRGGISFEPYCKKFNNNTKEKCRSFYKHKCVLCGMPQELNGKDLAVHHVNFDKQAGCYGKAWNLVCLCKSCHARTNYSRWYWFNKLSNCWCLRTDINFNIPVFTDLSVD